MSIWIWTNVQSHFFQSISASNQSDIAAGISCIVAVWFYE